MTRTSRGARWARNLEPLNPVDSTYADMIRDLGPYVNRKASPQIFNPEFLFFERSSTTHRPLSSSFLWSRFRILYGNPKKELLRGLWVNSGWGLWS